MAEGGCKTAAAAACLSVVGSEHVLVSVAQNVRAVATDEGISGLIGMLGRVLTGQRQRVRESTQKS